MSRGIIQNAYARLSQVMAALWAVPTRNVNVYLSSCGCVHILHVDLKQAPHSRICGHDLTVLGGDHNDLQSSKGPASGCHGQIGRRWLQLLVLALRRALYCYWAIRHPCCPQRFAGKSLSRQQGQCCCLSSRLTAISVPLGLAATLRYLCLRPCFCRWRDSRIAGHPGFSRPILGILFPSSRPSISLACSTCQASGISLTLALKKSCRII